MQGTHDIDGTTTADDSDGLDPREAARLLDQAKRGARREFDLRRPLVTVTGGFVVLVGYGALWLSVAGSILIRDLVSA